MTQRDILVLRKRVRCFQCGTDFDGYVELPDEGSVTPRSFMSAADVTRCSLTRWRMAITAARFRTAS